MADHTESKWPRTYHFAQSPGLQNDDRRLPTTAPFIGQRVIGTLKMDGEGATMNRKRTFPRSPDGRYHPSRDMMKAYHAAKASMIPELWRISGEYMYALHSIAYTGDNALPSWFLGFGVWDETNTLLSWDETLEVFEIMDIVPVPLIYDGPWHEGLVEQLAKGIDTERQEGFVIRVADRIPYPSGTGDAGRFFSNVAKWVRHGHIQPRAGETEASHWQHGPVIPNELAKGISHGR